MKVKELIDFMADLTLKTGYPVPVPKDFAYKWATNLNFNKKGKIVLYTGALYQLIPYIESLSVYLKAMELSDEGAYLALRFARNIPIKLINTIIVPEPSLIEWSNKVLLNIANLLLKSKIEFSYLYDKDIYSGVLLYDMGDEEKFEIHARKVFNILKESGAEEIITVDPHTTFILKNIYPKYIKEFNFDVKSYLELINIENGMKNEETITIHDSCIYARGLSIIDKPRSLLLNKGYNINEAMRSKKLTFCCGGPVESIFPSLSNAIAKNRVKELSSLSNKIVTMCPICYINLKKVSKDYNSTIYDISELLSR